MFRKKVNSVQSQTQTENSALLHSDSIKTISEKLTEGRNLALQEKGEQQCVLAYQQAVSSNNAPLGMSRGDTYKKNVQLIAEIEILKKRMQEVLSDKNITNYQDLVKDLFGHILELENQQKICHILIGDASEQLQRIVKETEDIVKGYKESQEILLNQLRKKTELDEKQIAEIQNIKRDHLELRKLLHNPNPEPNFNI